MPLGLLPHPEKDDPLTPYEEDDPGLREVWLEGYRAGKWPTRDEFSRMSAAAVNAFLESVGATVRVQEDVP